MTVKYQHRGVFRCDHYSLRSQHLEHVIWNCPEVRPTLSCRSRLSAARYNFLLTTFSDRLFRLLSPRLRFSILVTSRRYHAFGVSIHYVVQPRPEGIAQAFIVGKEFLGSSCCALVLGDNIFYGHDLVKCVSEASRASVGATVFAYPVNDPQRYGVVEFDSEGKALSLEEKPQAPKSRYAVTGLYFYDHQVVEIAESLIPSSRGELEITDVNKEYMKRNQLQVVVMGRGMAWLDTGTHQSMLEASLFIQTIETRQGLMVACPEEIAYRYGYITSGQLEATATSMNSNGYGRYLNQLLREKVS